MIEAWLSILFKLANLAVFICFLIYLYRRYIKEYVVRLLEQEQHIVDGLNREKETVVHSYNEYKDKVAQQQEQRAQMQKAIVLWQEGIAHEQARLISEKEERARSLKNKAVRQTELLRISLIMHKVIPATVARAQAELEQMFMDEKEGVEFVQRIITRLQESKS